MSEYSIGAWEAVTPNVRIAQLQPHGVTVGLVWGTERAVLIDAGSSPTQGAALLSAARETAPMPVTHLVVTHPHHDHWFGAGGMAGVTLVAHEDLTTAPDPEVLAAAAGIGLIDLPAPEVTFSLVHALDLGDERVELLHFGAAHTCADVVVIVPNQDVMFLGDLIERAGDPQFGPSSDVAAWPKVVDSVLGAATESTRFVPGHGQSGGGLPGLIVDRAFCFKQRADLALIYGTAEHLVMQGVSVEQAYEAADWPFQEETMRGALPIVYDQLAAKGVTVRKNLPLV
ncbi:MAG: MBL fold metallo-hydrolase [Propionibacteriaceae bacterium]|nr:MBL fold metallo-hydrolase [Propionibacteriaceae bacterium]